MKKEEIKAFAEIVNHWRQSAERYRKLGALNTASSEMSYAIGIEDAVIHVAPLRGKRLEQFQAACRAPVGKAARRTPAEKHQRVGKVVAFLREHPLSTSDEIWRGCGVGVMSALKWVCQKKYRGQIVWRLNHRKLRREGLE
jgi:hypothetical protein